MTIHLQGQLAVAANLTTLTDIDPQHSSVAALITHIAQDLPEDARQLILTPDGSLRQSLFVAVDNTHLRDTSLPIPPNTQTLTLMPPMAGG